MDYIFYINFHIAHNWMDLDFHGQVENILSIQIDVMYSVNILYVLNTQTQYECTWTYSSFKVTHAVPSDNLNSYIYEITTCKLSVKFRTDIVCELNHNCEAFYKIQHL